MKGLQKSAIRNVTMQTLQIIQSEENHNMNELYYRTSPSNYQLFRLHSVSKLAVISYCEVALLKRVYAYTNPSNKLSVYISQRERSARVCNSQCENADVAKPSAKRIYNYIITI